MSTVSDVITKIERDLPGFAWKVGTCCVSDDAWLVPDFNHPVHGLMLRRLFNAEAIKAGSIWDLGIDIDLRPSGRPAVALQMAYDAAVAQMKADRIWDAYRAEVDE